MKIKFDVRGIDAWCYDGGWTFNDSWYIGRMETSGDIKRAFYRFMKKNGVTFKRGWFQIEFDGDCYTIIQRFTGMPVYIAMPVA